MFSCFTEEITSTKPLSLRRPSEMAVKERSLKECNPKKIKNKIKECNPNLLKVLKQYL